MELERLKALYERHQLGDAAYTRAESIVKDWWDCVSEVTPKPTKNDLNETSLDHLIENYYHKGESDLDFFLALIRYAKILERNDLYIHLTKYTGMLDVLDEIFTRFRRLHSKESLAEILEGLEIPTLGCSPQKMPEFTREFVSRLETAFTQDQIEAILTGNNHRLSELAMASEKAAYEAMPSFSAYLEDRHQRKVEELRQHMERHQVWFEQDITPEVVEFVSQNQEVLSGVIQDHQLWITKIPYDTLKYLEAKDDIEKRYYACHCPYAREAILSGKKVSGNWCYCSAGFAKFPFETILGKPMKIKVIENALDGDSRCRFVMDLSPYPELQ